MIINERNTLVKADHAGHICEAYYDKDKTWLAALI